MKINILYIILPIIFILLFSYTVEGFDYSDQTEENILMSDNWCNCDKTCNLVNVGEDGKSGEAGVKNLEDTCDINYNFIDDLEKTDDKKQDLIKYCEGCLDILNKRCRKGKYNKIQDPIVDVDAWCGRAKFRRHTGRGVLERCRNNTGRGDQMLDQLIEYMAALQDL